MSEAGGYDLLCQLVGEKRRPYSRSLIISIVGLHPGVSYTSSASFWNLNTVGRMSTLSSNVPCLTTFVQELDVCT